MLHSRNSIISMPVRINYRSMIVSSSVAPISQLFFLESPSAQLVSVNHRRFSPPARICEHATETGVYIIINHWLWNHTSCSSKCVPAAGASSFVPTIYIGLDGQHWQQLLFFYMYYTGWPPKNATHKNANNFYICSTIYFIFGAH